MMVALPLATAAQIPDASLPGGEPAGTTASMFAPGLVSSAAQEYGIAVSKDWSEIYFTRLTGEHSVIMMIHRSGDAWSPATPAPFSGQYDDSHPWLAAGGDTLYFVSRRPSAGAHQELNVWFVERSGDGWAAPASLGSPVTDQTVHAPSVSAVGTIYATGLIQLRVVGERYLPAERLTPDIEGSHPAIASDESFLVFSARRRDGFGGKDLYVIFRDSDSSWTTPVNLGTAVNTHSGESSPTLSSDGRFLFFSRQGSIWWVDATVIAAGRPRHLLD
jgi:hypothetical protein